MLRIELTEPMLSMDAVDPMLSMESTDAHEMRLNAEPKEQKLAKLRVLTAPKTLHLLFQFDLNGRARVAMLIDVDRLSRGEALAALFFKCVDDERRVVVGMGVCVYNRSHKKINTHLVLFTKRGI